MWNFRRALDSRGNGRVFVLLAWTGSGGENGGKGGYHGYRRRVDGSESSVLLHAGRRHFGVPHQLPPRPQHQQQEAVSQWGARKISDFNQWKSSNFSQSGWSSVGCYSSVWKCSLCRFHCDNFTVSFLLWQFYSVWIFTVLFSSLYIKVVLISAEFFLLYKV